MTTQPKANRFCTSHKEIGKRCHLCRHVNDLTVHLC